MTDPNKFRFLPATILIVVVLGLAGGAFAFVRSFLNEGSGAPKKVVQEVQIIRPPPPPDVPPPPPPPAPEDEVDIPESEPDPVANDAAPAERLGLDAEGGAGGDLFGLVGRKGGRDLVGSGGSAFAWYAGLLKGEILQQLQEVKAARSGAYSVVVKVWVRSDGSIERIRLAQTTGDRERDSAIEQALTRIDRISQGPPADMPQPVSLKIVSRV